MSALQVILGEGSGQIKHNDRLYPLHPLRLTDLAILEALVGPISTWNTPEATQKLSSLEACVKVIWLSIRRNEVCKDWDQDKVGDMFGAGQIQQVTEAVTNIMQISGFGNEETPEGNEAGAEA